MGNGKLSSVFSVGGVHAQPLAVLTVARGEGIHRYDLIENLLAVSDEMAKAVIEKAEQWTKENDGGRLFTVTHPDNIAEQALFESLGYSKMILYEKKIT